MNVGTGHYGKQIRDASNSECSIGDEKCENGECEKHREKISMLRYTKTEGGEWFYLNFHSVELPDGMIWDSHHGGPR